MAVFYNFTGTERTTFVTNSSTEQQSFIRVYGYIIKPNKYMQSDIRLVDETLETEGDTINLFGEKLVFLKSQAVLIMGKTSILGQTDITNISADKVQVGELHGKGENAVICRTTDLILDSDDRRSEGHKSKNEMRRALVHDIDDALTINYEKDYPGGVYIQGNLKVEELSGYPTNGIICKATDLILDSDDRRSEDHKSKEEMRRALVHDVKDQLTINYAGDYPAGVKMEGEVRIPQQLVVGSPVNGVQITNKTIKLRTTQQPSSGQDKKRGAPEQSNSEIRGIRQIPENVVLDEIKIAISRNELHEKENTMGPVMKVYEIDLIEHLYALQAEIETLKTELAKLKSQT